MLHLRCGLALPSFAGNEIGDDGAATLADALKENATLTSINLESTSDVPAMYRPPCFFCVVAIYFVARLRSGTVVACHQLADGSGCGYVTQWTALHTRAICSDAFLLFSVFSVV